MPREAVGAKRTCFAPMRIVTASAPIEITCDPGGRPWHRRGDKLSDAVVSPPDRHGSAWPDHRPNRTGEDDFGPDDGPVEPDQGCLAADPDGLATVPPRVRQYFRSFRGIFVRSGATGSSGPAASKSAAVGGHGLLLTNVCSEIS